MGTADEFHQPISHPSTEYVSRLFPFFRFGPICTKCQYESCSFFARHLIIYSFIDASCAYMDTQDSVLFISMVSPVLLQLPLRSTYLWQMLFYCCCIWPFAVFARLDCDEPAVHRIAINMKWRYTFGGELLPNPLHPNTHTHTQDTLFCGTNEINWNENKWMNQIFEMKFLFSMCDECMRRVITNYSCHVCASCLVTENTSTATKKERVAKQKPKRLVSVQNAFIPFSCCWPLSHQSRNLRVISACSARVMYRICAKCHLTNHDTTLYSCFFSLSFVFPIFAAQRWCLFWQCARDRESIFIKVINLTQRPNKFIHF